MVRRTRRYSLFMKEGNRWTRLTWLSGPKWSAVNLFQTALLSGSFAGVEMGLRPVKDDTVPVSAEKKQEFSKNYDRFRELVKKGRD